MKTTDLINELATLPVEERAFIADSILKTLNSANAEIDQAWAEVAKQRLNEIEAGNVQMVSAAQVFERINKRLR